MTRRDPTPRQLHILELVAAGRATPAIASLLCITEGTVSRTLCETYARLGARDRGHAVALAYQRGLIPMPPGSTPRVAGTTITIQPAITTAAAVVYPASSDYDDERAADTEPVSSNCSPTRDGKRQNQRRAR